MGNLKLTPTKQNDQIINALSWAIPLAVALLIGIQSKLNLGAWTKVLPHVIGLLNTSTAISLLYGFIAVKRKQLVQHQQAMSFAFLQGSAFLVLYILYHISNPSTPYGGQGWIRPLYYFLLISHILLSIGVVRLVLKSIYFALSGQIAAHKKLVKWTFPIWLYVSISGVLVYLMIVPYYPQ